MKEKHSTFKPHPLCGHLLLKKEKALERKSQAFPLFIRGRWHGNAVTDEVFTRFRYSIYNSLFLQKPFRRPSRRLPLHRGGFYLKGP